MERTLEVNVMGDLVVRRRSDEGKWIELNVGGWDPPALLAILAMDIGEVSRDDVGRRIRGEHFKDQATYDWTKDLRESIDEGSSSESSYVKTSRRRTLRLRRDHGVWVDYDQFKMLRNEGQHAAALSMVRGDLVENLPYIHLHDLRENFLEQINESREMLGLEPVDAARKASHLVPKDHDSTRGRAQALFTESYVDNSPNFRESMERCTSLTMLGFSHNRMAIAYASALARLVEDGGRLRVLALDPDHRVVLDANSRSFAPKAETVARHQHEAAVATLNAIGQRAKKTGGYEIRLMDCLPPFTAYLFDEEVPQESRIFVWLTPWRIPSPQRPGFTLTPKSDPFWFEFFSAQVTSMWSVFDSATRAA